jgi:ADP-heptose:LPS heptosyltransferase
MDRLLRQVLTFSALPDVRWRRICAYRRHGMLAGDGTSWRVHPGFDSTSMATTGISHEHSASMPRRVLIIFPGALGDLICLGPALGVLAQRYRDSDLELMARAELADFAAGRMGVVRGHSIDRREVSLLFSPADDAPAQAAEFFGSFSSIHSFFTANDERFRQALARACRGEVFFYPFRPQAEGHISTAYVEALGETAADATAGSAIAAGNPSAGQSRMNREGLVLRAEDFREAERLLGECGVERGRFVLLMPGSGSPAKNWPTDGYRELACRLGESKTVMVLGPAETKMEGEFTALRTVKNPSLGALAALARMAAAFVGNDSGVSHLAAAAGGCGVVIFGPTDPGRWRPLGRVSVLRRMPLQALMWQEVADVLSGLPGCAVSIRRLW